MMKDELYGWKDREEVYIPPITRKGFTESIIIRKPVEPVKQVKQQREEPEIKYMEEDYTVAAEEIMICPDEEPTVLAGPELKIRVFICRIKTDELTEITKDEFIIGKSEAADLVVRDNPTISRKHALIQKREDGYWLIDKESLNHTFVDNEQIKEAVKLTDKMMFRLSVDEEFEFVVRAE